MKSNKTGWKKTTGLITAGLLVGGAGAGLAVDNNKDNTIDGINMELTDATNALSEKTAAYNELLVSKEMLDVDKANLMTNLTDMEKEKDEFEAIAKAFEAENKDLKVSISEYKTEMGKTVIINKDEIKDEIKNEMEDLDEWDGVHFDEDEISLRNWDDAEFKVDIDEDGDGEIEVTGFEIRYDDDNVKYDVEYKAVIEIENHKIDDIKLYDL